MTDDETISQPTRWAKTSLRITWIVVRLVLGFCLAQQGVYFVYQGF